MAQFITGERAGEDLTVHEFDANTNIALSDSADIPEPLVRTFRTIQLGERLATLLRCTGPAWTVASFVAGLVRHCEHTVIRRRIDLGQTGIRSCPT